MLSRNVINNKSQSSSQLLLSKSGVLPIRQSLNACMLPQNVAVVRAFGGKTDAFLNRDEVAERVMKVVKSFEKVDPKKVSLKAHFLNDLGLDSLDTVELVMAFEEEFVLNIPDDQAEKLLTVEEAINFFVAHPQVGFFVYIIFLL